MADMDTPLLIQTMQELIRTIRENSPVSAGQRGNADGFDGTNRKKTNTQVFKDNAKDPMKEAADRERTEKALKDNTKALKDTFKNTESYNKDAKFVAAAFQQSVAKLSLSAYDELPKRINELTAQYRLNIQSKEDIDRAANAYTQENIKRTEELGNVLLDTNATFEDLRKASDELQKLWGDKWVTQVKKSSQQLQEEGEAFYKALKKDTEATNAHASEVSKVTGFLKALGGAALFIAGKYLEAAPAAAKFNVGLKQLAINAPLVGMGYEEYAKLQNENMRGLKSSGVSLSAFNDILQHGSADLLLYTGSLEGGARVTAETFKNFRMLSANTNQQGQFMKQSMDIFKAMNETTGETWEQFNQLNQTLMQNGAVQTMMYRLGQDQRVQAQLEFDQTAAYLNTQGLLDEETKAVVATFAELGSQGPKERRKLAAQVAAVGGALGISGTQELSQMLARGDTQGPEFAKLLSGAQQQLQGQYAANKNQGGEFGQYALTNLNPQVASLFGQGGGAGLLGTRVGNKTEPLTPDKIGEAVAKAEKERAGFDGSIEKTALRIDQTLKAVVGKGIIASVMSLFGILTGMKWLKSFLSKGGATAATEAGEAGIAGGLARGLARPGLKGALKTFGGKIPLVGSLISGGITYAETGDVKQAAGNAGGTFAGAAAGGLAGAAIGSVIPIIGTAIGGLIGAGIGGYFGGEGGQDLVKHFEKAEPTKAEEAQDDNDKQILAQLKELNENMTKLTDNPPGDATDKQTKEMKQQHQENKQMTQEQIDAYNKTHQVKQVHTSKQLGSSY